MVGERRSLVDYMLEGRLGEGDILGLWGGGEDRRWGVEIPMVHKVI